MRSKLKRKEKTDRSVNSNERILLDRMHLVQLQLLRLLCLRHMQRTAGIIDLLPFCRTSAMSSSVWFSENLQEHSRQRLSYRRHVIATRIVHTENRRLTDVCLALSIHEVYPQNLVTIHIYLCALDPLF